MNEKIKEFARQAGADVMERSGWTDYGTLDLDVEQFAELIVNEVIEKCIEKFCGHTFLIDVVRGRKDIKRHFGVAE